MGMLPSDVSPVSFSALEAWLGECAVAFEPQPERREHWLGIVSSHSERDQWAQSWWQRSLDSALARALEMDATVLFSSETPYADIIRHACGRCGIAWREVVIALGDHSPVDACIGAQRRRLLVRLPADSGPKQRLAAARAAPADAAVAMLSHRLFALHARPHGKIATWIARRLEDSAFEPGSTFVAAQPFGLAHSKTLAWEREINAAGAVLWYPCGVLQPHPATARTQHTGSAAWQSWSCAQRIAPATIQLRVPSPTPTTSGTFLVHCTRSRLGPWPDQSWDEYLDEVLRGDAGRDWHPMDTLLRILRMQRLVATSHLRRGSLDTVCLSEERLSTLLANRRFQPHLGRWDWEPYGIAIRRSWLQSRGAQPVRYLSHSELAACALDEQPFVQPRGPGDGTRDWSYEKEWRIAGDVRLHEIGPNDAWVFVPSTAEASALAHESRWPVVVAEPMR